MKRKIEPTAKIPPSGASYATLSSRIKAFIVDMFMIYVPLLYLITYVVLGGKEEFQASQTAPFVAVLLYGVIYAFFLAKIVQTHGKRAYELKVVDDKNFEKIGFFRALLRFVLFLVSATTLLGLLVPLYRKDKKALHDIVIKTVVVSTPQPYHF
jgi:uncharacterized RDD family membrane protein YckC